MRETALIIVDVQNDFLPPSGALAVPAGKEIVPLLKGLLTDHWDWKAVVATQVHLFLDLVIRSSTRALAEQMTEGKSVAEEK